MDNFISTIVFLIPGFFMYFWIQSFGVNPVVKHSPTEMLAITSLLWLPVSLSTLLIYNIIGVIFGTYQVWTLEAVKNASGNLVFLSYFSFLSIPVSFLISLGYVKILYPAQRAAINFVRKIIKMAPLSETPSVWEEFFIKVDEQKNEGAIPVKIYKIDKTENVLIGLVGRASRPFETERALVLERCEELRESHDHYEYETSRKYVDLKTGIVIESLDLQKPTKNKDD